MAAKKARKRAYIPPSSEVVNKRERVASTPRAQRSQAQRTQRGGSAYAYPVPSLKRTAKRLPIYFALIFALQYWFAGQDARGFDTQERLVFALGSAAFVTVLFAPFMHIMDKFAYNRQLKRTGQQPEVKPPASKQG